MDDEYRLRWEREQLLQEELEELFGPSYSAESTSDCGGIEVSACRVCGALVRRSWSDDAELHLDYHRKQDQL